MMNKLVLWVICIGILLSCSLIAGCVNSHTAEIDHAKSLIKSASSRTSVSGTENYTTMYVGNLRANASAAKSDLMEAKNILVRIPQNELSRQDQTDIKALLIMLDVYIETVDILEHPAADFIEDTQTVIKSRDPTTVSEAGLRIKQNILVINQKFSNLSNQLNSIDETGLSPEVKGDVIYLKTLYASYARDFDKLNTQFASACIKKCSDGEVLGQDCMCHPACGKSYCDSEAECCKNKCYIPPGFNYWLNRDTCVYHSTWY